VLIRGYISLRNLRNLRLNIIEFSESSVCSVAKILRVFVVKFNNLCVLSGLCGNILFLC